MTVTPKVFRQEADRRLIDSFDLMTITGLRSREGINARMESGTLPRPVYNKPSAISLWDKDEVLEFTQRKESK